MMDSNEIAHIAIGPPVMVEANLIKEVAAIIDQDLYATQLLLSGKIPKIIAHYQTRQEAETVARRLRYLGLLVMVCKDSELRRTPASIFKALALRFGHGEIIFQDRRGTERIIKTENVFLILKGKTQIQVEEAKTKTKKELNLAATLLTGGIPIWHKIEEKTGDTSIQTEYFMRLYHRKSPEPDVEITQYGFDYSCLGADLSATTLANFNTLSAKMKELCLHSIFDDSLAEISGLGPSSTQPLNDKDIQCKLIYLYHEAICDRDSSA